MSFRFRFKTMLLGFGFVGILMGSAVAAPAVVSTDLNLRMGPSSDYSRVGVVPRHGVVNVHGCLSNYRWCDVSYRGVRGWVFAKYLDSQVRPRAVVSPFMAQFVGFPVASFVQWTYFRDHYPAYYKRHYPRHIHVAPQGVSHRVINRHVVHRPHVIVVPHYTQRRVVRERGRHSYSERAARRVHNEDRSGDMTRQRHSHHRTTSDPVISMQEAFRPHEWGRR